MFSISPRLPLLLATIAALGMVSATGWQAYGFWQSETASSDVIQTSSVSGNQQPENQTPDIALGSISMFGENNGPETGPAEEDLDNLPETNLRLVLRGVMSASGDLPGSALVEDGEGQTEAYIVGNELPGNATLRTVRADRIIIERAGALENLYFPEDEDRSGIAFTASESNSGVGDSEPDYSQQDASPASDPGPDTDQNSDSRREEIRQRLEQLRERLRNNN